MAFGAWTFQMAQQVGGSSLSSHYEAARKAMGRPAPRGPALPLAGEHIWAAFARLHSARSWSELGPVAISYLEIDAYMRVTREALEPWEIEAIRALDDAYRTAVASRS